MHRTIRQFLNISAILWAAAAVWLLITTETAFAGQVRVEPSDGLVFENNVKFSILKVINDGSGPVTIDIARAEWNQDPDGRDSFVDTQDLVVSPNVMTLAVGEQRVIRVGVRAAPMTRERVYRILIVERSGSAKDETGKRRATSPVSVPVFIKPAEGKVAGSLRTIGLADGRLTIVVNNGGNARLLVMSVSIRGAASDGRELFTRELAGSYVFSGRDKFFRTEIPGPLCVKLSRVEVQIKTSIGPLNGTLEVESGGCGP